MRSVSFLRFDFNLLAAVAKNIDGLKNKLERISLRVFTVFIGL